MAGDQAPRPPLTSRRRTFAAGTHTESRVWMYAGAKEDAIRGLGLTPVRHYQVLNGLLERADAWEYAPAALARAPRSEIGSATDVAPPRRGG